MLAKTREVQKMGEKIGQIKIDKRTCDLSDLGRRKRRKPRQGNKNNHGRKKRIGKKSTFLPPEWEFGAGRDQLPL